MTSPAEGLGSAVDTEPKVTPTVTKWTSGDFTLISSDNHIFKIDSFYLQAAS